MRNKLFPRHMTKEEFIQKAKEEHGNYYDYSKVRYTDENTRVTVICPKHGKFLITPKEHLEGKGCEQCVNERVDGFLSFINEHATKDSDYDSGLFNNEMLDDIFGTDEDDEEIRYIGKYSDDKTALIECPKDFSGTYVIPDGVEEILTCAFQDCKGLKTVIKLNTLILGSEKILLGSLLAMTARFPFLSAVMLKCIIRLMEKLITFGQTRTHFMVFHMIFQLSDMMENQ